MNIFCTDIKKKGQNKGRNQKQIKIYTIYQKYKNIQLSTIIYFNNGAALKMWLITCTPYDCEDINAINISLFFFLFFNNEYSKRHLQLHTSLGYLIFMFSLYSISLCSVHAENEDSILTHIYVYGSVGNFQKPALWKQRVRSYVVFIREDSRAVNYVHGMTYPKLGISGWYT